MRKYLLPLSLLAAMNVAAGPATAPSNSTPWELLVEAGQLPAADSPRASSMEYLEYPPYSKAWWDMTWDSEQQNVQQFALLRQSRLLMQSNGGRSGIPAVGQAPASLTSFVRLLNPQRNLANIVSDGALFSHLNGNDIEAVDRLLDNLNIAACIRQDNTLIGQLVAVGIEALGCSNIDIIAPSIRLTDSAANASTRKATIQLIHQLLDEATTRQAWRTAFAWELQSAEHPRPHGTGLTTQPIPMKPDDVNRDLPILNKACEFQNLPASLALVKECHLPTTWLAVDRLFTTEFRVLAERRMSAINMAIELFRADHQGAWPKNLDELVPAYLLAIPRDPFRTDDAPIEYKIIPHGWPDGKDRPVLFVDAGPDFHIASTPYLAWYNHGKTQVRQYRDLTLPETTK